jgi:copper chaperone CopZ
MINLVPGKGTDKNRLIETLEKIDGVEKASYHPNKNTVEISTNNQFNLHIMDVMNEINIKTDYKSF